jgi:hypothetical protein
MERERTHRQGETDISCKNLRDMTLTKRDRKEKLGDMRVTKREGGERGERGGKRGEEGGREGEERGKRGGER